MRPRGGTSSLLGGEQVEGHHAVRELLTAARRTVHEVLIASGHEHGDALEEIAGLACAGGVPVRSVDGEQLVARSLSEVPQGVLARAEPVVPVDLAELTAGVGPTPFLVLLDGVTDPHNLGAILRSASCAGVTGVVLPKRRSADLSPACVKAAAGAVEHLGFALVSGTGQALQALGRAGVWRVGLDGDGESDLEAVRVLDEPLALVLGAEGRGLAALTKQRCDVLARIPLVGPLPSLNVASAAAVAFFTVLRHRTARAAS